MNLKGNAPVPHHGPNFLNFMQFFGTFGKILCWRPLEDQRVPAGGNPGSVPGCIKHCLDVNEKYSIAKSDGKDDWTIE